MNFNYYNQINITDFPSRKIYVLLNKKLRTKLIYLSKIKLKTNKNYDLASYINKQSSKYGLNSKLNGGDIFFFQLGKRRDNRTNKIHLKSIPLWIIFELINLSKVPLNEVHNNILAYRSGGRGNLIFQPKLPILVTPEFESIIFHIFGDGHAGEFTPSYYQKNKLNLKQFVTKLKNCFGEFKPYYNHKKFQVRFPKAITDIFKYYYKIQSYHSNKIRIPSKIYHTNKLSKLACIMAFILDEGHIRDLINISSKNKIFLLDLKKLIEKCGYNSQKIKPHLSSNTFYLNISNKSIELIYKDYINLIKLFPTCSLSSKHEDFVYIIKRRKNKAKSRYIDKVILDLLKCNRLTPKQVSQKTGYANSTILRHLYNLYKKDVIKRHYDKVRFVWYI